LLIRASCLSGADGWRDVGRGHEERKKLGNPEEMLGGLQGGIRRNEDNETFGPSSGDEGERRVKNPE